MTNLDSILKRRDITLLTNVRLVKAMVFPIVTYGCEWKLLSRVWLFVTPCDSPWNSPGQNTGVGRLSLLQGIFPTQGLNPGLLHCGQILDQLSHKGSPGILEWVASPFSRGSSWPRNQTGVSCIAGRFFTNWVIRETQRLAKGVINRLLT